MRKEKHDRCLGARAGANERNPAEEDSNLAATIEADVRNALGFGEKAKAAAMAAP